MGAASPLWFAYGAAASAGVAFWWMTSWTRAVNFEALTAPPAKAPPAAPVPIEIVAEPTVAPAADIAEPAPAPSVKEPAPVAAAPDDLTRLSGIGPKLSVALAARGVTAFAQIAAWTDDDLAEVDKALSLKGRAVREAWVAQARRLAGETEAPKLI
ncbi:MAG: helix-hairpin-helix domain-containing protein [Caulobacterales bacterium]